MDSTRINEQQKNESKFEFIWQDRENFTEFLIGDLPRRSEHTKRQAVAWVVYECRQGNRRVKEILDFYTVSERVPYQYFLKKWNGRATYPVAKQPIECVGALRGLAEFCEDELTFEDDEESTEIVFEESEASTDE